MRKDNPDADFPAPNSPEDSPPMRTDNMNKRYGGYEQVNGATVNDALDKIDQLEKDNAGLVEALDKILLVCNMPAASKSGDLLEISRLARTAPGLAYGAASDAELEVRKELLGRIEMLEGRLSAYEQAQGDKI